AYFLIYAFNPIITGLPSIFTSVSLFPLVLATTSVFPDALGVGVSRSAVMISLLPSIFAVIAMRASVVGIGTLNKKHDTLLRSDCHALIFVELSKRKSRFLMFITTTSTSC